MDDQKKITERLQTASNVLVTVSSNPSVDGLAACIGLTLALNKLDKHSTAVFSGAVPDTIEFLKPEKTLEKSADSLRDFIISLDKSKADKLRYKVEDKVVKIFITPYKTSLSEDDLYFSQGDFNVDVVMALGVIEQRDLDQAITAHGRILHDATVISVNNNAKSQLGSINWQDNHASSLSEMVASLVKQLGKKTFDEQIATAFLTGVVAETDRFRNDKTTAQSLSISAELMSAGANQRLITSQLDHSLDVQSAGPAASAKPVGDKAALSDKKDDGTLGSMEVDHSNDDGDQTNYKPASNMSSTVDAPDLPLPSPTPLSAKDGLPPIHDTHSSGDKLPEPDHKNEAYVQGGLPPAFNSSAGKKYAGEEDGLTGEAPKAPDNQLLHHDLPSGRPPVEAKPTESIPDNGSLNVPPPSAPSSPPLPPTPPPATKFDEVPSTAQSGKTTGGLDDYLPLKSEPPAPQKAPEPEQTKPEFSQSPPPPPPDSTKQPWPDTSEADIEAARSEVMKALNEQPTDNLPPVEGLNAQDLGGNLHDKSADMTPPMSSAPPSPSLNAPNQQPPENLAHPANQPLDMPPPASNSPYQAPPPPSPSGPSGSNPPPPPVPPPMMPPSPPAPQR